MLTMAANSARRMALSTYMPSPGKVKTTSTRKAPLSKPADQETKRGNGRQHGVAQGVAVDDAALGESLAAGRAHVVAVETLEHRGAHHLGQDGRGRHGQRQGWQRQVLEAVLEDGANHR